MIFSKKPSKPTEAELEILAVLWDHGPSSVRFVNDQMNRIKRVGYTTTLKFMQIMTDKGLVVRHTDGRTHVYTAAMEREMVQEQLLDNLLVTAFGGSAQKLVMQALGNHRTTSDELQAIKDLISKLEGGTE